MRSTHFIAMDTHCQSCDIAVVSASGKLVRRASCETTLPALIEEIERVRRPRVLTFEEGPLADWLARGLRPHVDRLIVCDPRQNAWIAKEGEKSDSIDASRLAQLLRGNYLKEVHHPESLDRSLLKQHVAFYHDRVRERVRQGHQVVAQLRRHGLFVSIAELADPQRRAEIWRQSPPRKLLRQNLNLLWQTHEFMVQQEEQLRSELLRLARRQEPVRRFVALPGVGWIRAITFYAYLDTPARFRNKSALFRYCGLGLERRHSGSGRARVRLTKSGNRRLKDVLLGAAKSAAARRDNPFADKYHYWTQEEGKHPSTARRNVARSMASTLWSLWKTGSQYDPAQVRGIGRPLTTNPS